MNFELIYPKDIMKTKKQENAVILDLRSKEEYINSHWPGAYHYPQNDSDTWGMNLNRRTSYILYCEHGGSSFQAASKLGKMGLHVFSVVGGYEAMKKIQENYFKIR